MIIEFASGDGTVTRYLLVLLWMCSGSVPCFATFVLKVQPVQVCDDAGSNCTNLGPAGGADTGYLYASQLDTIWSQAQIDIDLLPTVQWNNTAAQRLTFTEQNGVFDGTFTSASGAAMPGLPTDAVQVFFVKDFSGTGYNGTIGTGWVDNPLTDPAHSARNSGLAELFIDGRITLSNGRAIMANEGFISDSLSGTFAHEIGHLLGLRHVEDVNAGAGNGSTQDPSFTLAASSPNLMWSGGPNYSGALTLTQNYPVNSLQVAAARHNGMLLDPDMNGLGVLQAVPEPSSFVLLGLIAAAVSGKLLNLTGWLAAMRTRVSAG